MSPCKEIMELFKKSILTEDKKDPYHLCDGYLNEMKQIICDNKNFLPYNQRIQPIEHFIKEENNPLNIDIDIIKGYCGDMTYRINQWKEQYRKNILRLPQTKLIEEFMDIMDKAMYYLNHLENCENKIKDYMWDHYWAEDALICNGPDNFGAIVHVKGVDYYNNKIYPWSCSYITNEDTGVKINNGLIGYYFMPSKDEILGMCYGDASTSNFNVGEKIDEKYRKLISGEYLLSKEEYLYSRNYILLRPDEMINRNKYNKYNEVILQPYVKPKGIVFIIPTEEDIRNELSTKYKYLQQTLYEKLYKVLKEDLNKAKEEANNKGLPLYILNRTTNQFYLASKNSDFKHAFNITVELFYGVFTSKRS